MVMRSVLSLSSALAGAGPLGLAIPAALCALAVAATAPVYQIHRFDGDRRFVTETRTAA